MIDISTEDPLALPEICSRCPPGRLGKKPHLSCVLRWILKGAPGPNGQRIKLRAARIGGRWFSSVQAVQEFIEALTPDLNDEPRRAPRTATKRQRASEKAARELEKAGI